MNSRLWRLVPLVTAVFLAGSGTETWGQKTFSDGIRELASQIGAGIGTDATHKKRIAVIPFRELDGRTTVLGTYLAEELVTALFQAGGLEIIERGMLDRVFTELKLADTGAIDPNTAREVGRIAGVDAIVTGSVTDLQSYISINCRLISTETGQVFGASQTKIVKDDDVRKIMGIAMPSATSSGVSMSGESSTQLHRGEEGHSTDAATPEVSRPQSVESTGYLFELKSCGRSGGVVVCTVMVTNKGQDRQMILYGPDNRYGPGNRAPSSRLIDELGDEHLASDLRLGTSSGPNRAELVLASGIPTKASLSFSDLSGDVRRIALLEIATSTSVERVYRPTVFIVKFNDIQLSR